MSSPSATQPMFSLAGRVALVTGAGQGIGAAIARRLAAAGAKVGVLDLSADNAATIAREAGGIALVGDVTREAEIERALRQLADAAGSLDILVNNAGIVGKVGSIADLSRADLESVLEINLVAPFLLCRAVLPGMLA